MERGVGLAVALSASSIGAVVMLALPIAGLLYVRFAVAEPFRIPQEGMAPGLPAGQTFWVDKRACHTVDDVRRGDVVVFRRTGGDGLAYNYVWRVIGLPGERVVVRGHRVSIDDEPLELVDVQQGGEGWTATERDGQASWPIRWTSGHAGDIAVDGELVVPRGHLYVLGDNRLEAVDSRSTGPVAIADVIGCRFR